MKTTAKAARDSMLITVGLWMAGNEVDSLWASQLAAMWGFFY